MKKIMVVMLAAVAALSSAPAFADSINAEVRLGDIRGGARPNTTEFDVNYNAPLVSYLNYGAEVSITQANKSGPVNGKVSVNLGPNLPTVLGFTPTAYVEVGRNIQQNRNYNFWGVAGNLSRDIYGPVRVNVGYRHREGFARANLREERVNAGLGFNVTASNTLGVNYYRTTGTTRSDAVAFGLTHRF